MQMGDTLMLMQTSTYSCPHTSVLLLCAISSQHVTVMNMYSSMDAAIVLCMVSNCCLSLYLNVAGLRQHPGKMLPGSWKVLEFFVTVGV